MPTTYGNPPKFNVGNYNGQHIKNLSTRAKKVERLYLQAVRKMARAAQPTLSAGDAGQEFHWKDFPALGKEINALARDLTDNLQLNIEAGDKEAWALSNTKNDAMVDAMAGKSGIPKATLQTWKAANLAAMNAFIGRKEAGMELSGRVWKLGEQFKAEMELALETCIGKGMSAAEISREIRQYLQYPDKLFRRVRDEKGVLRLSKAAQAFHPGTGVYRSSYKNALRMTATETNMAYRTADHGRWNALPFVLGQMISTSNNHPVEDICDELAGRYPKEFKFTGWHPWCRCYAVAILADQKEMDEYTKALMDGEDVDGWHFTGEVTDMPECWTRWVKANRGRIASAKSQPYFIRDNQKAVDKILKGKEGGKAAQDSIEEIKDYTTVKSYDNGGRVYRHRAVSTEDSDYSKIEGSADFFARQGKIVRLTPKRQWSKTFDYDEIYGSLKGTKYYGKCPDLSVDGIWYEHEGFKSDKPKNAFRNMMRDGLRQSNRIIIDRPELTERYMRRSILGRIKRGEDIKEVWLREKSGFLSLLYKETDG